MRRTDVAVTVRHQVPRMRSPRRPTCSADVNVSRRALTKSPLTATIEASTCRAAPDQSKLLRARCDSGAHSP